MADTFDDDEDAFLYGDGPTPVLTPTTAAPANPPAPPASNGTSFAPENFELDLAGLEELRKRVAHVEDASYQVPTPPIQDQQEDEEDVHMEVGEDLVDDRDGDEDEEEEEESDVEIIMEEALPVRSMDFRTNASGVKPLIPQRQPPTSGPSAAVAAAIERRPIHLTTEYTALQRPQLSSAQPPALSSSNPTPRPPPDGEVVKVESPLVTPIAVRPPSPDGETAPAVKEERSITPQNGPGERRAPDPALLALPPALAPP
ncbi:hypothetical protein FRC00_013794, partial [Tulasnella sp. 408]